MELISKSSQLNTVGGLRYLVITATLSLVPVIILIDIMAILNTTEMIELISRSVPLGFHSAL